MISHCDEVGSVTSHSEINVFISLSEIPVFISLDILGTMYFIGIHVVICFLLLVGQSCKEIGDVNCYVYRSDEA